MNEQPPVWLIWAAFGWVAFVVMVSVIYRRRAGKPIFPKVPVEALYSERWASGPFAHNCLLVWLTKDSLSVVPRFPFNLMFLPEVYRLERTISLFAVRDVNQKSTATSNLVVSYGYDNKKLRLRLRNPTALAAAIMQAIHR